MAYCMKCGNELEAGDMFCTHCGTRVTSPAQGETTSAQKQEEFPQVLEEGEKPQEKTSAAPVFSQEDLQKVKTAVTDVAGKAVVNAQKIASTISQKVEEQKSMIQQSAQKEILKENYAHEEEIRESRVKYKNDGHSKELWTCLKKNAKRQQFHREDRADMPAGEYMQKVQEKIVANHVPAQIELRKIRWDGDRREQEVFMVRPETKVANPLSCLLQFNHVGNFTFVEEKTFITPPDLPEYPGTPKELDPKLLAQASWLLKGLLIALVGFIGLMLNNFRQIGIIILIIGAALAALGYYASVQVEVINDHNRKCEAQRIRWNQAWIKWKQNIFLHSFQEDTNGHLSRIFDSVFACIKQVNSELFEKKAVSEEDERADMNELEQLIARRQEEYR